jgi:hypothetical protein
MIKIYKASNFLTVPIVVDGKIVSYADFNDERFTYRTGDKKHQKALEALPCFGKLFTLSETVKTEAEPQDSKIKSKVYSEITDWQDASELLAKDYDMDLKDLNTPDAIMNSAKKAGVEFPNLK